MGSGLWPAPPNTPKHPQDGTWGSLKAVPLDNLLILVRFIDDSIAEIPQAYSGIRLCETPGHASTDRYWHQVEKGGTLNSGLHFREQLLAKLLLGKRINPWFTKTEKGTITRTGGGILPPAGSPDLNEQSSSPLSPQLAACPGEERTRLLWGDLGGGWPEAGPLRLLWPGEEYKKKKMDPFVQQGVKNSSDLRLSLLDFLHKIFTHLNDFC